MEDEERHDEDDGAPVGYLELLRRNHDFRQLWLGQVVSQLGDWFNTIALYTLILQLTGSGRDIGLMLVARFLPSVVLSPVAGVVADRFDRRTVMIASDIGRAVVVLGFMLVTSAERLWLLYALTVLQLALSTFFEPAKTATVPSVVSPRELVAANAITSVTWSVMLTLGAALGGLIAGWFGTDAAFLLDSLTYIASAVLIARVRLRRTPQAREQTRLTLARALGITATLEGLRYVRRRRRVLVLLLVKPAWCVGGGILSLLAVFGEKVFPLGGRAATGIGVLYAARGIGTGIGPFLARRLASDTRGAMQAGIGVSFFVAGLFYAAFGQSQSLAVALPVLAVAHMGGSVLWVYSTSLLQSSVADEYRGRVFATELALVTLALAASNYATGEALERFGYSPRTVAVAIGAFFLLPGALWFATRRWWDAPDEL
ncbi:MAG TPA: MFS transporter [Pyrinomonadaceae bacterium]|nr:MFS transporter [Pyrinomonadaceae bacterium]